MEPLDTYQGLVNVRIEHQPAIWEYNLQQILEGDVKQIPKKGRLPNPEVHHGNTWKYGKPMEIPGGEEVNTWKYPLVNVAIAMEHHIFFSG